MTKVLTTGSPPRVLHIITALGTGGAERQLESLVEHSTAESQTIALYSGGVVADAMRTAGHRVDELGLGDRSGLRKLVAVRQLVKMIRAARPDVVHVHLLAAQLWGIPAARLAGVRNVVSSEHSLMDTTIENRPLTPTLRRVYRLLERLSSHTIAVSTTTRARLLRWKVPADRISVVDNGIDFARLAFSAAGRTASRSSWGVTDSTVVVGAVGRLEPVKRFPQLVEALAPWLLAGDRRLVLVGDGPLRSALENQVDRLGIADKVILLGSRPDIPALLSGFDLLASPSQDETFGMAVIEALGSGLPVVYAQCPALDELAAAPALAYPLAEFGLDLSARTAVADRSEIEIEAAALLAAVEKATADLADNRDRIPPVPAPRAAPAVLINAYGINQTAHAVDELYARFTR